VFPTTNIYPFPFKSFEILLFLTVINFMVLLSAGNVVLINSSLSSALISLVISNSAKSMLPRLGYYLKGIFVALIL
jgi:hypothetical protein